MILSIPHASSCSLTIEENQNYGRPVTMVGRYAKEILKKHLCLRKTLETQKDSITELRGKTADQPEK